jgi:hypothetical protein
VKRRQLAAVSAVEGPIIEEGRVVKAPKIRTHDKLKALDMLAKMAKLYPAERLEHTGADGGPVQTANLHATVHQIDIEALEPEQRTQLRSVLLALKTRQAEAEEPHEAQTMTSNLRSAACFLYSNRLSGTDIASGGW